jgi:hypothetical protein
MSVRSDADLEDAFKSDGFQVERTERYKGARGILARSTSDSTKIALYIEGAPYERGYLIGSLAHEKVELMTTTYVDNLVPAFITPRFFNPLRFRRLKQRLMNILRDRCMRTYYKHPDDIPRYLKDEMMGIAAGCKAQNPDTPVSYRELFLLNTGIDFLLSYVYTGAHIFDWIEDLKGFRQRQEGRSPVARRIASMIKVPRIASRFFRIPLACNAFSLTGDLTQGAKHYLGRDFMFPTAGVFQDTCCLLITDPGKGDERVLPVASVTAPGIVGSMAALNSEGVALGVDMVPGQNCNYHRPGLNSLLMVRYCADHAHSIEDAEALIVDAQRGVPWLYVVADGKSQSAAVVEAGKMSELIDNRSYVPEKYRQLVDRLPYRPLRRGLMIRESGFVPPADIAAVNASLFKLGKKPHSLDREQANGRYHMRKRKPWKQKAVPKTYYFPPQRESRPGLLIVTNQFLTPEMRLSSMGSWASIVATSLENDLQWRYDELNSQIREMIDFSSSRGRKITLEEAKSLIDFLSPRRKHPAYYAKNACSATGKRIEGAIVLFDLTDRILHSYYGYYDNNWLRLRLPAYC